jgi:hypothetical protein
VSLLFLDIFFLVSEPLSGANNTPTKAPTAAPASTPTNNFPVLMFFVLND